VGWGWVGGRWWWRNVNSFPHVSGSPEVWVLSRVLFHFLRIRMELLREQMGLGSAERKVKAYESGGIERAGNTIERQRD
jgi:hypothetical protein